MAGERDFLDKAQAIRQQMQRHHDAVGEVSDMLGHAIDFFAEPDKAGHHLGELVKGLYNLGVRASRAGHAAPNGPTGPVVDADPNPPNPQQ